MAGTLKSKKYILYLFVAGATMRSAQAINGVKRVCAEYLKNNYELTVIDIYQQPELARREQIIAVPTLVRKRPDPLRRFIGNLMDSEHILSGLK